MKPSFLVNGRIKYLQGIARRMENKIAELRAKSNASYSGSYKAIIKQNIVACQNCLLETRTELAATHKQVEQCRQQACQELKKVQTPISALRVDGLTKSDQKLLDAINSSIFEKGADTHTAFGKLTDQAKDVLVRAGVKPEILESMLHADALKKYLLEELGSKVNDTAALSIAHANDGQIILCTDAFNKAIPAAVDMIKTGTASQAVAATKITTALNTAAHALIELKQGASASAAASSSVATVPVHVQSMYAEIRKDVATAYALCTETVKQKGHVGLEMVKDIWSNNDVKAAVVAFCIFQPEIGLAVGALASIPQILSVEIAGTIGVATVEMAEIATINGVTMSAPMARIVQETISQGRIAATQEAVTEFVQQFQAPFLSSGEGATLALETQLPAIEGVATAVEKTKEWWQTYNNTWTGNTIKTFDAQKLNMEKIARHMFTDAHMKDGLSKLGKTPADIFDKIIKTIQNVDAQSLLKNGLTNQIRATMSGQLIEIRVHIVNGDATLVNAFVGHPNRDLGNIVRILEEII